MESEDEDSVRGLNEENVELLMLHAKAQEALAKGKPPTKMVYKLKTDVKQVTIQPEEE